MLQCYALDSALNFFGFGGSKVKPIGFKDVLLIDSEHFQVTIHVAADSAITIEAVIGDELHHRQKSK